MIDGLSFSEVQFNIEDWIKRVSLTQDNASDVREADVVFLPIAHRDVDYSFYQGTVDFFHYCKQNFDGQIAICINDSDYNELELNSKDIRLGRFSIKKGFLTFFLSVLGSYCANQLTPINEPVPVDQPVIEYMNPPKVSFTLSVVDSAGVTAKEIKYEGLASDIDDVIKEVETLWKDDQ